MDSKLKLPALKVARWAFKHGEFFDLYDVKRRLRCSIQKLPEANKQA